MFNLLEIRTCCLFGANPLVALSHSAKALGLTSWVVCYCFHFQVCWQDYKMIWKTGFQKQYNYGFSINFLFFANGKTSLMKSLFFRCIKGMFDIRFRFWVFGNEVGLDFACPNNYVGFFFLGSTMMITSIWNHMVLNELKWTPRCSSNGNRDEL